MALDTAHKARYVGGFGLVKFCEDLSGLVRGIQFDLDEYIMFVNDT